VRELPSVVDEKLVSLVMELSLVRGEVMTSSKGCSIKSSLNSSVEGGGGNGGPPPKLVAEEVVGSRLG
jgi:hypothetical protein